MLYNALCKTKHTQLCMFIYEKRWRLKLELYEENSNHNEAFAKNKKSCVRLTH